MASMIRSIAPVTRRPIAATMISSRSMGALAEFLNELKMKRISGKQVKVEATIILEGLDVSELKSVLPVVQQHLSSIKARKAVIDHLGSLDLNEYKTARVGFLSKVNFQGYENSELEPLGPWVEQYSSVPPNAQPQETDTMTFFSNSLFKKPFKLW